MSFGGNKGWSWRKVFFAADRLHLSPDVVYRSAMTKVLVFLGSGLVCVGLALLFTLATPTRAQLEGGYGDLGGDLQRIAGYLALGLGVTALAIALVRVLKRSRTDPDLPPEYRI